MRLTFGKSFRGVCLLATMIALTLGSVANAQAQTHSTTPYTYSDAHNKRLNEFVEHVANFVVRHEIGHMYISEYNLTVFGEDESVADDYAAYVTAVFKPKDGDAVFSTYSVQSLIDVTKFWKAFSVLEASDARVHGRDLAERHGSAEQRAARVGCFLYGLAPKKFGSVADYFNIRDRDACVRDAARRLKENQRIFSEKELSCYPDHSLCPSVAIIAEPWAKGDRAAEHGAQLGDHIGVTLEAADRLSSRQLPRGMKRYNPKGTKPNDPWPIALLEPGDPEIKLVIYRVYTKACAAADDYNAFWEPSTRSLVICYHLIDLIDQIGMKVVMDEDK